mmetsp:Transcript_88632/g.239821  ORF Transcript_88632/g.239821 Transcript_88632/m.239821 type:complete len:219 (+) Transcript_88632:469-1125(+)
MTVTALCCSSSVSVSCDIDATSSTSVCSLRYESDIASVVDMVFPTSGELKAWQRLSEVQKMPMPAGAQGACSELLSASSVSASRRANAKSPTCACSLLFELGVSGVLWPWPWHKPQDLQKRPTSQVLARRAKGISSSNSLSVSGKLGMGLASLGASSSSTPPLPIAASASVSWKTSSRTKAGALLLRGRPCAFAASGSTNELPRASKRRSKKGIARSG